MLYMIITGIIIIVSILIYLFTTSTIQAGATTKAGATTTAGATTKAGATLPGNAVEAAGSPAEYFDNLPADDIPTNDLTTAYLPIDETKSAADIPTNDLTTAYLPADETKLDFHTISGIYNNIEEYFNLYFSKLIDVDKINQKLNENIESTLDSPLIKFQDIFKENQNSERAQLICDTLITNIYGPIGLLLLSSESDNDIPFQLLLLSLTNIYNIKKQEIKQLPDNNYNIDRINYLYNPDYATSGLKIYTSTQYNKSIPYENATPVNNMYDILSSKCLVDGICYMNKDYFKNQILTGYKNISISEINDNYNDILEYILCMIVIFTIYISNEEYENYKQVWFNESLAISRQIETVRTSLKTKGILIDTLIQLP